jgi:hypothetical protein
MNFCKASTMKSQVIRAFALLALMIATTVSAADSWKETLFRGKEGCEN